LVAACSTSSDPADDPVVTAPSTSAQSAAPGPATPQNRSSGDARDYASPSVVATALGCGQFEAQDLSPSDESYADQAGQCTLDGEQVAIVTFAKASQRAAYETIGETGSGAYPHWVLGTTWAVATLTRATADAIASMIGGAVH
jgi:hypothetical protein